ncbi:MAG: MarR family transcriptional regulator [Candidatus Glassbacteria bacterium]|nr:MarR family transcriptional regulator [Candidatus Glassbacteria bacterium]
MSLWQELGYSRPFKQPVEETMLNIVHTGSLLVKEGYRVLRPFGLTDAQFNVLMLLRYNSVDGRINQTSLGRMMLVNRSNVTGLVDRMEKAGLVRRVPDPQDRRVNCVELTAAGLEAVSEAHAAYFDRLSHIMSTLSAAEREKLIVMLEKVRSRLKEGGEKG